jgi:hypothetical protein
VAPEADKDIAGASITTVQLFATAFGAASAARWLFLAFALAPLLAVFSAWRCAAIAPPAAETGSFVPNPSSREC